MNKETSQERLISILQAVQQSGGKLVPRWQPHTTSGYTHFPGFDSELTEQMTRDLDYLANFDYLDRIFHDRLSVCPACNSHLINVREACVDCGSANIAPVSLLHHFRCGYVAHIDAFQHDEQGGRRCPKCHGRLQDLGTDHDSPGENFVCHSCSASFQVPQVEGICLSCNNKVASEEMLYRNVYSYRLSSLGVAAITYKRLFERDEELLFEVPHTRVYRRHVFMTLLEDERYRAKRYGLPFAMVALNFDVPTHDDFHQLVERLEKSLRSVDKIGRYDEDNLVILMPDTEQKAASHWLDRFLDGAKTDSESVLLRAAVVEITDDASVIKQLGASVASLSEL